MGKEKFSGLLLVAVFVAACMTLGGLVNAALREGIYWVPFIVNLVVYGCALWRIGRKIWGNV